MAGNLNRIASKIERSDERKKEIHCFEIYGLYPLRQKNWGIFADWKIALSHPMIGTKSFVDVNTILITLSLSSNSILHVIPSKLNSSSKFFKNLKLGISDPRNLYPTCW